VLDESRAKRLIDAAAQSRGYMGSPDSIAPLMSRSMNDYKTMSGVEGSPAYMLGYLIKENLVTQRVIVEDYPNVSGTWIGEEGNQHYKLELHQAAGSIAITGTCEQNGAWHTTLTGTVLPSWVVQLEPPFRQSCLGVFGMLGYRYKVRVTRGQPQSEATASLEHGSVVLRGVPSGTVTVTTYEYAFSPEVKVLPEGTEFGRYQVGEVTGLLLDGETRAHATFSWQVALNKLGAVILNRPVVGRGNAVFAKKPDGTWVLAEPIRF
jgi:hypothetical protein